MIEILVGVICFISISILYQIRNELIHIKNSLEIIQEFLWEEEIPDGQIREDNK